MNPSLQAALARTEELLISLNERAAADRLSRIRRLWESSRLNIVVFGAFNRGKSTLLNALLGELILPAKLVPTTGHVTRITYGQKREVHVLFADGTQQSCRMEDLDKFSLLADRHAWQDIDAIEVSCPSPLLKSGLTLIDTPGVQDSEAQTLRAERAVADAHLILMVLDARYLLPEWEQLLGRRFSMQLGKPLILVVNKMNLLEPADRADVRNRVDRWSRQNVPVEMKALGRSYLEIDALGALRHELKFGTSPSDDFAALRKLFTELNPVTARELRSRGNCGVLKSEASRIRVWNDRENSSLRNAAQDVARERHEQMKLLTSLGQEFQAIADTKEEAMLNFARKRLVEVEQEALQSWVTNLPQTDVWETFRAALVEVEAEAVRMAVEIEAGLLANPVPFTVSEELLGSLKPVDALFPLSSLLENMPVAISRFRVDALRRLVVQWRARASQARSELNGKLAEQSVFPQTRTDELRLRQSLEKALSRLDVEVHSEMRVTRVVRRAHDLHVSGVGGSAEVNWEIATKSLADADPSSEWE